AVVAECLASISGAGQRDRGLLVVMAAVIEDKVHGPAYRIYGHPLEELICSVVNGISVHAHWSTPGLAVISGRRKEDVYISIAVVTPGHIQSLFLRINAYLRKSIRA